MQQAISNEYAVQYLDRIGVSPSRENIALLLREMPLRKCHVGATWRTKGWLKDQFIIIPDGKVRPNGDTTIHEETLAPQTGDEDGSVSQTGANDGGLGVDAALLDATVNEMAGEVGKMLKYGSKAQSRKGDQQYLKSVQSKHVYPYNKAHKSSIKDHQTLQVRDKDGPRPESRKQLRGEGPKALEEATDRLAVAYREIVLEPLEVTSDALQAIHDDFVRIFPFHRFKSKIPPPQKKTLEAVLTSPEFIRLAGLLCHYLYWNIVRQQVAADITAGASHTMTRHGGAVLDDETVLSGLNNEERKRLFLDMMRCFNQMQSTVRDLYIPFNLALSCVLLSLRTSVDRVFCTMYRWFRMRGDESHESRAVEMLTAMQQEVTRLMDPNLFCTHIAELGSSRVAMQLIHSQKRSNKNAQGCYHTTSSATRTLFPRPKSVGARRIMHKPGKPSTLLPPDDERSSRSSASSTGQRSPPELRKVIFKKGAVRNREILDTEKQARLYASVLAKLRQQYKRAYSRSDDKQLLEREVMLEPIDSDLVDRHTLDLKRFQQELFEERLHSISSHLRHPASFSTDVSTPKRIETPPSHRRREVETPADPSSPDNAAGLKVKRDTTSPDGKFGFGSTLMTATSTGSDSKRDSARRPGSPWTDLRGQTRRSDS